MAKMVKIMDDFVEVGSDEWRTALDQRHLLRTADKYARIFDEYTSKLGVEAGTRRALMSGLFAEHYIIPSDLTYKQYLRIGADLHTDNYGGTRFASNGFFESGWNHRLSITLLIKRLNDDIVLVWSRSADRVKMLAYDKNGAVVDVDKKVFKVFVELENSLVAEN